MDKLNTEFNKKAIKLKAYIDYMCVNGFEYSYLHPATVMRFEIKHNIDYGNMAMVIEQIIFEQYYRKVENGEFD
jgi:hypothetical protein